MMIMGRQKQAMLPSTYNNNNNNIIMHCVYLSSCQSSTLCSKRRSFPRILETFSSLERSNKNKTKKNTTLLLKINIIFKRNNPHLHHRVRLLLILTLATLTQA